MVREFIGKKLQLNKLKKRGVIMGRGTTLDSMSTIGDNTYIGNNCCITKSQIGRYSSIANNVAIGQGEHDISRTSTSTKIYKKRINIFEELTKGECIIGNDVWIGANAVIRRGVIIGDGAVIGANSFVNKDVPPYAVAGGCPAKVIKYRFSEEKINYLVNSRWWEKDLESAREFIKDYEEQN